LDFDED
jgi:hypothetical protein